MVMPKLCFVDFVAFEEYTKRWVTEFVEEGRTNEFQIIERTDSPEFHDDCYLEVSCTAAWIYFVCKVFVVGTNLGIAYPTIC